MCVCIWQILGEIDIYHPLKRLIRFEAYGILFVIAGIFGALLAPGRLDLSSPVFLVFIAASSAFGFVINDISDQASGSVGCLYTAYAPDLPCLHGTSALVPAPR